MTVNSEPVDTLDTSATVLEAATEHETEQIVMQQVEGQVINGLEGMVEGQVIMMTNAAGEEQHVVITSAGSISQPSLNGGGQVIQVQSGGGLGDGGYLLDSTSMKSEPEDLSFTVPRHSMDLEAGAQAIQASAANAVQNVLRSLKETETKTIVTNQQLVPAGYVSTSSDCQAIHSFWFPQHAGGSNSSAERGCHLITEFMNQVHSEDARQDLVQCVQYWRSMIQSDLSKESLKNI